MVMLALVSALLVAFSGSPSRFSRAGSSMLISICFIVECLTVQAVYLDSQQSFFLCVCVLQTFDLTLFCCP